MNTKHYILTKDKKIKQVSLMTWAKWFEGEDRIVKREVVGKFTISTVFLGIDHNFSDKGKKLLFETMVFGDEEQYQERYSTYQEALEGHEKISKKYI